MEEQQTTAELKRLLVSQKSVFNVEDLSLYTGLSKSFIYKLTSSRKIPHSCPNGKLIFFDRVTIEKFLMSNPIETNEDINQSVINYSASQPARGGQRW